MGTRREWKSFLSGILDKVGNWGESGDIKKGGLPILGLAAISEDSNDPIFFHDRKEVLHAKRERELKRERDGASLRR